MTQDRFSEVAAAFETLLEGIETEIDGTNRCGARAFDGRDYDGAREALERAAALTTFREKASDLRREWERLLGPPRDEEKVAGVERRDLGRLKKGMRTREDAYYRPILQVLLQFGGAGKMSEVLERVLQIMRAELKPVDFEPLASDPDMPRWHNAAQWARNSMVKEGLLKADSSRGVWEISGRGREFLLQEGAEATAEFLERLRR